jgi:hypothetical protein
VKAISYFVKGVQGQDESYLNAIENPEKSPLFDATISKSGYHKYQNYDVIKTGPFCNHS